MDCVDAANTMFTDLTASVSTPIFSKNHTMQTTPNPLAALIQAMAFAADKHRNQRRKDAEASPYINHPIALANVLANEGGVQDVTVLCAAVLHDTIDDTKTTPDELRTLFGEQVATVGLAVTDDKLQTKARCSN